MNYRSNYQLGVAHLRDLSVPVVLSRILYFRVPIVQVIRYIEFYFIKYHVIIYSVNASNQHSKKLRWRCYGAHRRLIREPDFCAKYFDQNKNMQMNVSK